MQIGYLGPSGTFSEQAATLYCSDAKYISYHTIDDVIQAVDKNLIEVGIVPIENSIEGTVNVTMDTIIFNADIKIIAEIVIPIEQNFLVSKNYNNEQITKILSHPQALAQCREFLNKNYHHAQQIPTSSTSEAAKLVASSNGPWAALGNLLCAKLYNMKVLYSKIQDNKSNETRFIVISKKSENKVETESKTSIAFSTNNEPGALFKILNILALWNINMTKIISRPMKKSIGEYVFFVEVEGDISNEDMQEAMKMVQRKTSFYKLFGSYTVLKKEKYFSC